MTNLTIKETRVRLDKWLWAARFFKTRNQAKQAIEWGKVHVNQSRAKAARPAAIGDTLEISRNQQRFTVKILAISEKRAKAHIAQSLYEETVESINAREGQIARQRMERAGLRMPNLRPSKKGRRELRRLKQNAHEPDLDLFE